MQAEGSDSSGLDPPYTVHMPRVDIPYAHKGLYKFIESALIILHQAMGSSPGQGDLLTTIQSLWISTVEPLWMVRAVAQLQAWFLFILSLCLRSRSWGWQITGWFRLEGTSWDFLGQLLCWSRFPRALSGLGLNISRNENSITPPDNLFQLPSRLPSQPKTLLLSAPSCPQIALYKLRTRRICTSCSFSIAYFCPMETVCLWNKL